MSGTKSRILKGSLLLFNEEGEEGQSAVDIANALDISPGNLYYHFKGKDAVIRALYDGFDEEVRHILAGASAGFTSAEDHWVFAHIILEEFWDFRFFFQNLGAITQRYSDLATRFARLRDDLRDTAADLMARQVEAGVLNAPPLQRDALAKQIVDAATFWIQAAVLDGDTLEDPDELIGGAVYHLAALIAPYLPPGALAEAA
ncbi:MAG: TetR/AcrR family transcriptional regulator, partial [Pseudomonadota bacterium]